MTPHGGVSRRWSSQWCAGSEREILPNYYRAFVIDHGHNIELGVMRRSRGQAATGA